MRIVRGAGGLAIAGWLAVGSALAAPADGPAEEAPTLRRIALVVGSNDGGIDRTLLRYANTDARAFAEVLSDVGGVAPEDVLLIEDATKGDVDAAFVEVAARVGMARLAQRRVEVLIYYSGHADETGLLPGGDRIGYAALRAQVKALDADVRVSVVDSCASGSLIRSKGGVRRAPFLVDQAQQVQGEAFLTSSTADEASQESDAIGASYFTHHLVAGLRGAADVDADGLVTLSEAYTYTFRETRESTESTRIGPQTPNYALDLAGQGDFVMTDLRQANATLMLEATLDGELWIRRGDGSLLIAVDKVAGKPMRLSVPADTYRVRLARSGDPWMAQVSVEEGAVAPLRAEAFLPLEQLADGRARGGRAVDPVPVVEGPEPPPPSPPPPTIVAEHSQPIPAAFQVWPGAGASQHKPVHGIAAYLFHGVAHALHGSQMSLWGARVRTDLKGSQLAMAFTSVGGDAEGFQGAFLFNHVRGALTGVQSTAGVNVIGGASPNGVFATQLALVGNVAQGGRRGAQLSAAFNVNGRHLAGVQAAAGINLVGGDLQGLQMSALGNITRGKVTGVQLSTGFNGSGALAGAQIAPINVAADGSGAQVGLINVAGRLTGTQVGLINVSRALHGEAIGLLTFAGNGYHAVEIGFDDIAPISTGLKFGGRHVYTALLIGGDPTQGGALTLGAGLGGHVPFGKDGDGFFDVDVVARNLETSGTAVTFTEGLVVSLRTTFGGRIAGPFGLYIGPAFHAVLPFSGKDLGEAPSVVPGFALGGNRWGHVGGQAGMRFSF